MKEVRGSVSLWRVKDEQDVDKLTNQETLTPLKENYFYFFTSCYDIFVIGSSFPPLSLNSLPEPPGPSFIFPSSCLYPTSSPSFSHLSPPTCLSVPLLWQ